jgi:hypothetical protein
VQVKLIATQRESENDMNRWRNLSAFLVTCALAAMLVATASGEGPQDSLPVAVLLLHGDFAPLSVLPPVPGAIGLPAEHYLLLIVNPATGVVLDAGVMPTAPLFASLGPLSTIG